MAIEIKAPLADRLFAIGSNVGQPDQMQFKGQGDYGSYRGQAPQLSPQESQKGGRAAGIGAIAGSLLGAYMQKQGAQAPTDAKGNGFGLGGNLASGTVGDAGYAGDNKPGLLDMFNQQEQNAGQNGLFDGFTYGGKY